MARLAFVGLGAMGRPMAGRLLDAGHTVAGYNRTPGKAQELVGRGLTVAASPRAAAEGADAVFSMVTDNAALRAVALGADGIIAGLGRGATWVEMSTVSPVVIRELEPGVHARGAALLDGPVSGSPLTIAQGRLSVMVGGDPAVLERVRPYLTAIGPTVVHVGPLGLAKTMKVATNAALAVQMLSFAEAVLLAEKAGIARERAVEALLKSVIASPMLQYRGPFVLGMPAEAWFDVPMMQKDLQLALDLGHASGVVLPSVALMQEWLTMARGLELGAHDFAVVFDVLAGLSGLPPSRKDKA